MARSMSMTPFECTVCAQRAGVVVRLFPFNDHRHPGLTPLIYCIECRSAHFIHDPRADESLDWHISVRDRNLEWSVLLLRSISSNIRPGRVIDIGCGIGTWLCHLSRSEISGLGFDTARKSVEYGRGTFGLDLRCELFDADHAYANAFGADLLTAIMVMEHLSSPRTLAKEIGRYCARHNARFYVTVPWFDNLGHLDFDSESVKYNVFNGVGAHVTYFSREGMVRLMVDCGMRLEAEVKGFAWAGMLFARS